MNRPKILKDVSEFMAKQGKFLSMHEYQRAEGTPANFYLLRKLWGSWSRIKTLMKVNHPDLWEAMEKGTYSAPEPVVEKKAAKPAKKQAVKKEEK